jgi:hypothetical protein
VAGLPLALALAAVAGVWLAGCVWSFEEQTAFATAKGFAVPELLPLVLDGLAVSLAGVAYAAALDGRAAVQARAMTACAVAASSASNGAWAWTRTSADVGAVVLAAGVPVAANVAFEVLLGELRRQVHRRRGLPAPVAVPWPRPVRLALAPVLAWREWRDAVLTLTAPLVPVVPVVPVEAPPPLEPGPPPPPPVTRPEPAAKRAQRRPAKRAATATGSALPEDVLTVGRQVAADLAADGATLTRRTLADGFRSRGQSLSSDRASALLRALRA